MSTESFVLDGPAGTLSGVRSGPDGGSTGLPVLLLHGINMSRDVWTEVAERLSATRDVIAFDLRGHGSSTHQGPFTAEDYAADALAVLDGLKVDRVHAVGTSFGGSVACALAVEAPSRVATVASFGGALTVEGLDLDGAVAAIRGAGVRDFFAAFMPQASFAPGTDPALLARALDAASNGRAVETVVDVASTALTADTTSTAEAVQVPALVVTGELDMTCPVPAGAAVAKALRTEHVVLAGRGHVVSMECPDEVASLIEQHASRHDR